MANLSAGMSVGAIVLEHSECAQVLRRHRIDYCCQGAQTLEQACERRGVEAARVLSELTQAITLRGEPVGPDLREVPTGALVQHVVERHHRYLREALPFAVPLAKKVARVHGDHDPRLRDLRDAVEALGDSLVPHLDQEEKVLFPALTSAAGDAALIATELADMHADHLEVAALLERIHAASGGFTVPDWACTSYSTLLRELCALEADLFTHVHLENQVLLPRFQPRGA